MNTIVSGALPAIEVNVVGRNHKQGDYTEPAGACQKVIHHTSYGYIYQVNVNPPDRQKQVVMFPLRHLLLTFLYILLLSVFKKVCFTACSYQVVSRN